MYESVYNHFLRTQFESAALGLAFTIGPIYTGDE